MKMGPQEEDYIETVFTCKGDYNDPNLHLQLEEFYEGLRSLLLPDSCQEKLILKKVEPWNSVRVTFNIPRAAALKLKQLAQQGDTNLRRLGVLAVQIEGDQSISLTIAGKNNERTELVFRTGLIDGPSGPMVSVFDKPIMSRTNDGGLAGGPGDEETTRKNIADYLRQGNALMDSLLTQTMPDMDVFRSPNVVATSSEPIPFHSGSTTVTSPGSMPSLNTSPLQHLVFPPGKSPTGYPTSPSRSLGPLSPSYNFPHGLPGIPAMGRQVIGNLILPPPPPYPLSQVVSVNNIQKPNKTITSSSPLLVNLLQNDPSGGLLNSIMMGKLQGTVDEIDLDALLAAKKRRKRKKKKRLAAQAALRAASMGAEDVPNPAVASTSSISLPGFKKSTKKSKPSSETAAVADHSAHMLDFASCDTAAGKLVNPYTGHLEPAEGSSTGAEHQQQQQHQHRYQQQLHHQQQLYQEQQQLYHQQQKKTEQLAEQTMEEDPFDTIQATINRVAAAWPLHVTSSEDTVSTNSSAVPVPPSSSPVTMVTSTAWTPAPSVMSVPGYSQPSSTAASTSPLSASLLASSGLGSHSETPTSTFICDRPKPELYHRPSAMSYPHTENTYISSDGTSEPLHKAPLLGMQHMAFSVGLPQVSKQSVTPSSLSSTPSLMHPQRSMQAMSSTGPLPLHTLPRPPLILGDHPDSFSHLHGLPGGLNILHGNNGNTPFTKTNNSLPAEVPRLHLPRQSGTPPSASVSIPVTFHQERPRSTGSCPLSYTAAAVNRNFGKIVSDIPRAGSANISSVNPGLHPSEGKHTHIRIQASGQSASPGLSNSAQGPAFIHVTPSETQQVTLMPKTELSRKGSEEISNSNHDSGLSSQSEPADDNQLTDETASSCETQGSPPLTSSESAKLQLLPGAANKTAQSVVSSHSIVPPHLIPHHNTIAENAAGCLEASARPVQTSCVEARKSPSLAVHSRNIDNQNVLLKSGGPIKPEDSITVLHWNTRDGIASSGSHCVNFSGHVDSINSDQQNLLCRNQQPETGLSQEQNRLIEKNCVELQHLGQGHGMSAAESSCKLDCRSHGHLPLLTVSSDQHRGPVTSKDKSISLHPSKDYINTVYSPRLDGRLEAHDKFNPDIGRNVPFTSNILHGYGSKRVPPTSEGGLTMQTSATGIPRRDPMEPGLLTAQGGRAPSTQINTTSASAESRLINTTGHATRSSLSLTPDHSTTDVSTAGLRAHQAYADPSTGRGPSAVIKTGTMGTVSHSVPTSHVGHVMDIRHCQSSVSSQAPTVTSCPNVSNVCMSQPQSVATTQGQMLCHTASRGQCSNRTSGSGNNSDMNDIRHGHGHPDLMNCVQSSVSQPNTQMCNTMEAAAYAGTPAPPIINVTDSHLHYTTHSHTTISQTAVSQSPHKSLSLQKVNAEGAINGPIDSVDILGAFPDDLANCHGSDYFNQKLDGLDPSFDSRLENLNMSLPVISSDILDQELWKNYSSTDLQASLAVPQAVLASGRSSASGMTSAIRQSNSPDQLKGSNVTSMYTRKSPTGNAGPVNMLSMFSPGMSGLPLPKRLTESIQKLVKPLPLEESRNQAVRKSPSQKQSSLSNSPPRGNIHSHTTATPYSRSPPLGYESALQQQGISSVLTPPKSPVRAGLSDGLSVGSSKPVSPRALSPSSHHSNHSTSPVQLNVPVLSNPAVPASLSSVQMLSQELENNPVGVSQSGVHPAADRDHPNISDNTDSAHVHSWNGATFQITGQQQSLHEQSIASADNNSTSSLSVMSKDTDLCKEASSTGSNTMIGEMAVVNEMPRGGAFSMVDKQASLGGDGGLSSSSNQEQTSVSINTGISAEQDLCKANLSCSNSSIMHPESVSETHELAAPTAEQPSDSLEVVSSMDSARRDEPHLSPSNPSMDTASSALSEGLKQHVTSTPVSEPMSSAGTDRSYSPTRADGFSNVKEVLSNINNSANEEPPSLTSAGQSELASAAMSVAMPESELQKSSSASLDNCSVILKQEDFLKTSANPSQPLVMATDNNETRQTLTGDHQSTDDSESETPMPNNLERANLDHPMPTSMPSAMHHLSEDCGVSTAAVSDHPVNNAVDTPMVTPDSTAEVWAKPEEDPPRQQRSTRRSNSQEGNETSDSPVATKTRGGKTIERESPRLSRNPRTLRRKSSTEEDTGVKTSPESDASPQLRQRGMRSRRKLPEIDDNPTDNPACKRSKVNANEDSPSNILEQDGELDGQGHSMVEQNDIGDSVDQNLLDSTGMLTDHPGMENISDDATAKNIPEDKSGGRQAREARKIGDNVKHVLRDSRREVKVNENVNDNDVKGRGKATERSLRSSEEEPTSRSSRGQQTRRSKQTSAAVVDKSPTQGSRDRSPVQRTRNRTPDLMEELNSDQQYKRTTRSTKPKEQPELVTTAPAANRRRRSSRDHR